MRFIKKNKRKTIITGSEGLLGKEISKYLEKTSDVLKLDLTLGHGGYSIW